MKCWLASFPRSGNTYFRNILYYVYGLESSTWHKEPRYPVDENYDEYDFVKTHLLPGELIPADRSVPAIYLVRDGRDALVSIAHHRSDIIEPGSDYSVNLYEAIIANNNSYFGGWSKNVNEWLKRADIVIRFEDLIKDPERVFKRVEALIEMPEARWDQLPDFKELKFGRPKYGGQTTSKQINIPEGDFSKKFFRKGKSGSWKDDMSAGHLELFWHFHADMMERMGYSGSPTGVPQNRLLDSMAMDKLGLQNNPVNHSQTLKKRKPVRVLIDGNILLSSESPSAKRNFTYFLKGLVDVSAVGSQKFFFDLLIDGKPVSLNHFLNLAEQKTRTVMGIERVLPQLKSALTAILPENVYYSLSRFLRNTTDRKDFSTPQHFGGELSKIQKNNVIQQEPGPYFLKYDLYHNPFPQTQTIQRKLPFKTVMTVYGDHLISDSSPKREECATSIPDADFYITTSVLISDKLRELHNIKPDKIFFVAQTAEKELFYKSLRKKRVQRTLKKYSVYSTSYILYKTDIHYSGHNFTAVIKAFDLFKKENPSYNVILLVLGKKHKFKNIAISMIGSRKDIQFSGRVAESDLKILYSNALMFIDNSQEFESVYSDLEARLCKAPVVNCNGVGTEELREYSMFTDAFIAEDISLKMNKLYLNKLLRSELAEKSYKKTLELTRRRTIAETLKAYERISESV